MAWGLSSHAKRIFILQKRIIRLIFNLDYRESCRGTFIGSKMLTLPCIYLYRILTFIHAHRGDFLTNADIHKYETRSRHNFCLSQHSHAYYERSPLYAGTWLYNFLPQELKQITVLSRFKRGIRALLSENAFYSVGEYVGWGRGPTCF